MEKKYKIKLKKIVKIIAFTSIILLINLVFNVKAIAYNMNDIISKRGDKCAQYEGNCEFGNCGGRRDETIKKANVTDVSGISVGADIPAQYSSFAIGSNAKDGVSSNIGVSILDTKHFHLVPRSSGLRNCWGAEADYVGYDYLHLPSYDDAFSTTLSENDKGYLGVKYTNVGEYNGKIIDIKAVVTAFEPVEKINYYHPGSCNLEPVISFYKGITNGTELGVVIYGLKWVTIEYQFYEHNTTNKVAVNGYTTFWDIDAEQGAIFSGYDGLYVSKGSISTNYRLRAIDLGGGVKYIFYGSGCNTTFDSPNEKKDEDFAVTGTFSGEKVSLTYVDYWPLRGSTYASSVADYFGLSSKPVGKFQSFGDYSLDGACENCESTLSNSKAMVVQDTTSWDAILASNSISGNSSNCGLLRGYFLKDTANQIYCREEYHVYFPNESNKIITSLGRYFTLNADEDVVVPTLETPNFKPVKVTRVRECKNKDNNASKLNTFKNSNSIRNSCTGNVYITYNAKNSTEEVYNLEKLKLVRYGNAERYTSSVTNGILREEVTYNYTLPSDTFSYLQNGTGRPYVEEPNAEDTKSTQNLGFGILPVPFTKSDSSDITLKFKFELPSNDKCESSSTDSKMYQVNNKDNNVLNSCVNLPISNVYAGSSFEKIENSACAKLYGTTSGDKFNACKNDRTTNKMGNCYDMTDVNATSDNYVCHIPTSDGPPGDDPGKCETDCNESNFSQWNTEWSEKEGKCCCGGRLDQDTGLCELCTKENHEELGKPWNEETGKCEPSTSFDLTYRVIGLSNPFVGKAGETRRTGNNWCYYDSENKYICSGAKAENQVVNTVIPDETVYSNDHVMYRVILDSTAINNIREYNKKYEYDDWSDMRCADDGTCTSEFLNDSGYFKGAITGNCAEVVAGSDNFYKCKKAGGN